MLELLSIGENPTISVHTYIGEMVWMVIFGYSYANALDKKSIYAIEENQKKKKLIKVVNIRSTLICFFTSYLGLCSTKTKIWTSIFGQDFL